MKLTTEIMMLIFTATAFAVGFAVRCVLSRIYSNETAAQDTAYGSPSRNNSISFSRSIRERSSSMTRAAVISTDHKLGNIFVSRKLTRPFVVSMPESADQAERNLIECFYKLVYGMLANGK